MPELAAPCRMQCMRSTTSIATPLRRPTPAFSPPARRSLRPLSAAAGDEGQPSSAADKEAAARKQRMERLAQSAGDIAKKASEAAAETAGSGAPPAAAAAAAAPASQQQPWHGQQKHHKHSREVDAAKWELLAAVASLDRGFAATSEQAERVEELARELEALAPPVVLSKQKIEGEGASSMQQLAGRWRLLYSSAFGSGGLGGQRPGPPAGLLPLRLGQVYQDIEGGHLDNVVTLRPAISLAGLLPRVEPPALTARLRHTFNVPTHNTVQITFESTEVKGSGGLGGWLDRLPPSTLPTGLRPPRGDRLRSASFDVVYLDDQLRLTRGDRGELRVFLKEGSAVPDV